jgi:hypothetical protein
MTSTSRILLVLATAACGATERSPDTVGSAGTPTHDCSASTEIAKARVTKIVQDNIKCSADTDCVRVGVHASCFDACSAAVNLTGKGAVDRASTLVEAAECKTWNEAGCQLTVPPCAPPQPVACVEGTCR